MFIYSNLVLCGVSRCWGCDSVEEEKMSFFGLVDRSNPFRDDVPVISRVAGNLPIFHINVDMEKV